MSDAKGLSIPSISRAPSFAYTLTPVHANIHPPPPATRVANEEQDEKEEEFFSYALTRVRANDTHAAESTTIGETRQEDDEEEVDVHLDTVDFCAVDSIEVTRRRTDTSEMRNREERRCAWVERRIRNEEARLWGRAKGKECRRRVLGWVRSSLLCR